MTLATIAIAACVVTTLALIPGCGKNDGGQSAPAPSAPPPASTPAATALLAPPPSPVPDAPAPARPLGPTVDLQLACVANTMAYDKTTLTVPTRTTVHLTIKNNGTSIGAPHNWVLVKPGTEASVASAGLKLGEAASYVDVRDTNVLAHTALAKPGETVEVTFTAPAPGDYPYICTLPGHYLMMKGVLTVTP